MKHISNETTAYKYTTRVKDVLKKTASLLVMSTAIAPLLLSIFLYLQLGVSGCLVPCVSTVLYG